MTTKWQAKNIAVARLKGTAEKRPVVDERDGTVGGYHVVHWDDHQDAVVMPKSIRVAPQIREER